VGSTLQTFKKSLLETVNTLHDDVTHLKSDTASLKLELKSYDNQLIFVQGNFNIRLSDYHPPELVTKQTMKLLNQPKQLRRNLPGAVLKLLIRKLHTLLYQLGNQLMKYLFW
jgi:hypothetical protein